MGPILRFCNDYRKLNEVSQFDSYPMPHVDKLTEQLGRAHFISMLDLTKGYLQVPLTPEAYPKNAFCSPSSHWQSRVLLFGVHRELATFQQVETGMGLLGVGRLLQTFCAITSHSRQAATLSELYHYPSAFLSDYFGYFLHTFNILYFPLFFFKYYFVLL